MTAGHRARVLRIQKRATSLLSEVRPIPTHYRVVDENVAWRVADDEAVLLHADTSAYFGLNRTGTLLWSRLADSPWTLDQLTAWARSSFPDAPAGIGDEIAEFIDQLVERDLLQSTESAEPAEPGSESEPTKDAEMPPWEPPAVERFGELEKLILSGE